MIGKWHVMFRDKKRVCRLVFLVKASRKVEKMETKVAQLTTNKRISYYCFCYQSLKVL